MSYDPNLWNQALSQLQRDPNRINEINSKCIRCQNNLQLKWYEKDGAFKRNQICVEYYNKIMGQNGKYLGRYIAKVEVVGGSGHSFQCWKRPRKSKFNGAKNITSSNETAFDFMYSHTRNPFPTDLSLDTKCFLTPLRNYYTQRGNTFYNIEVGKNPSNIIQVQINYNNNTIIVKEGSNFKINLSSNLFRNGDVVNVVEGGKTTQYRLQKDANYALNNMKLFCDPYYGFDSYVTVGNFQPEVNVGYQPQPPAPYSQAPQIPKQASPYSQPQQYQQYQQYPPRQMPQTIPASNPINGSQQTAQYGYQQVQRGYGYQVGQPVGYQQVYQQSYQQGYQQQIPRGYGGQRVQYYYY